MMERLWQAMHDLRLRMSSLFRDRRTGEGRGAGTGGGRGAGTAGGWGAGCMLVRVQEQADG